MGTRVVLVINILFFKKCVDMLMFQKGVDADTKISMSRFAKKT